MKSKKLCYIIDVVILLSLIAVWGYILIKELPIKTVIAVAVLSLMLIILGVVVLFMAMRSNYDEKKPEPVVQEDEIPEEKTEKKKVNNNPPTQFQFDPSTEYVFGSDNNRNTADETEIIPTNKNYRIELRDKNNPVKTYQTSFSDEAVIGRIEGRCNIVIADEKSISRCHCRLFVENGRIMAEDLKSSNRTYINGTQVGETALEIKSGDELKMGRAKFIVTIN